jgi:hypothetical protein
LIGINYVVGDFSAMMKLLGQSICPFSKRELSMTASHVAPTSVEPQQGKPAGNCGPMSQQGSLGAHGHEMHPQEFVRLIGCSDQKKQEGQLSKECAP